MAQARLCITVLAPTMEALRHRRDSYGADELLELRLDAVDRPDVQGALEGRRGPVIVTCRSPREGGLFRGSEEDRVGLLEAALDAGADFVDVEFTTLSPAFARGLHRDRIVVSMHDFDGIPPDLEARVTAMRGTGAGTVKVAVMAARLTDTLSFLERIGPPDGATVALAMGEAGVASRVLASRFGSPWTYAADEARAAPGQLSARRMRSEFRVDALGPHTATYGVVGRPVAHSLSPAMHNAAFAALSMDAVYLPLAAHDFDDFIQFADALPLAGASVTAPFKVAAYQLAEAVDRPGRDAEAINTLRRVEGRWEGRNTDVDGFLAPLRGRLPLAGARATVLGAGGAARAVAMALGREGAAVAIAARRRDAAHAVAARGGARVDGWPPARGSWDLLVNATPVGTAPRVEESPLEASDLDGRLVYDLVYNPPRTRLMADAEARGCETLGGLDMLVAQAVAQFQWWTGATPSTDVMRNAALAALEMEKA